MIRPKYSWSQKFTYTMQKHTFHVFVSVPEVKSDWNFPVSGQLGLPKLFHFVKCHNNERENFLENFILFSLRSWTWSTDVRRGVTKTENSEKGVKKPNQMKPKPNKIMGVSYDKQYWLTCNEAAYCWRRNICWKDSKIKKKKIDFMRPSAKQTKKRAKFTHPESTTVCTSAAPLQQPSHKPTSLNVTRSKAGAKPPGKARHTTGKGTGDGTQGRQNVVEKTAFIWC